MNRLSIFERKILRAIYGPTRVNNEWRIRYNQELYELFNEPDVIKFIKMGRLRWAGHVARMEETRPAIRALQVDPGGQRQRGRPRARWEDEITDDARTMGVKNWMRAARNRDEWRRLIWTARTQEGL